MKSTLLAVGAVLSVAGAAHGADPVAGSIGTSPGAPTQSFGAIPGMPGAGAVAPSFGALPGAPGSPTYQPFSALPSLGNQGTPVAPEPGTSASGFNAPNSSSGAEASGGPFGSTGSAGARGGG